MEKVELLSPVGNMECLDAAIEGGCDAVYLSGTMFGARSFAGNFNNDELKEAIIKCHLYGVKVYVTVNTIIYEREVDNFIDYIRYLHEIGTDAVIMQDIGMIDLVRKKFPNLEIHASTQMHIHNFEGAKFIKKLGIKRVVMARETSIDVIKEIKKKLNIEVETFIHGALCVCYSGQCLMSSLIGNRSGNRGTCTQCCRKPYDLYDLNNKLNTDSYLLSTKDLCTINNIDKIIESGVDSLKIEGRMKRPEYVYLVTKIYRKVIDKYYETGKVIIDDTDLLELKKIFNRQFTKGFMFNEDNNSFVYQTRPNHQGIKVGTVIFKKKHTLKIKLDDTVHVHDGLRILDIKEDRGLVIDKMYVNKKPVETAYKGDIIELYYDKFAKEGASVLLTTDYNSIINISNKIKEKNRKVLIDVSVKLRYDDYLSISLTDGEYIVNLKSDFLIEKALNNPISEEVVKKQLCKTGDTIYKVHDIDVNMDDDIFVNIKDLNKMRRDILEKLNKKRIGSVDFKEEEYRIKLPNIIEEHNESILINDRKHYDSNYDITYTENASLLNLPKVLYKVPRVINNYNEINNRVLIGELGSIIKYKEFDTDFSFNVVNSYSVAFLHSIGAKKITLSYELTISQIENIVKSFIDRYKVKPNLEVIYNSYPEAMICKFDLNKMYGVSKSYLKDQFNFKYKVVSYDDYMKIYNYKKIIYDKEELYNAGITNLRINKEI